jgi:hypothetical protein
MSRFKSGIYEGDEGVEGVTQRLFVRLDGIQHALPESVERPPGRDAGAAHADEAPLGCAYVVNGTDSDLLLGVEEPFPR